MAPLLSEEVRRKRISRPAYWKSSSEALVPIFLACPGIISLRSGLCHQVYTSRVTGHRRAFEDAPPIRRRNDLTHTIKATVRGGRCQCRNRSRHSSGDTAPSRDWRSTELSFCITGSVSNREDKL